MDIENSSNGYCNVIFIGKQGIGKTTLINKIFKKKDLLWFNNGEDIVISDNYHNVKTNIKEINLLNDQELRYLKTHHDVGTIFILISYPSVIFPDEKENLDYEKRTVSSIKSEFPNSIILVYVNGEIDENLQSFF
jgi:septin family protein